MRELINEDNVAGFKKAPLVRQFIIQQRNFVRENILLQHYLAEAQEIDAGQGGKEALKQLRALYQDRQYAVTKVPAMLREQVNGLQRQIAHENFATQIPHVFYCPMLKINPERTAFNTIRQLIRAMNGSKDMRDQLASLKNRLNDKVILFASLGDEQAKGVFAKILEWMVDNYGSPSLENVDKFYNDLMFYLEQYSNVIDTLKKAQSNSSLKDFEINLMKLCGEIINELLKNRKIDRNKIEQFREKIATIESESLLARFKQRLVLENKEELIEKFRRYTTDNPRFKILNPKQINTKEKDAIRTKELIEKGFKVLRLWESEVEKMNYEIFIQKMKSFKTKTNVPSLT